MSLRRVAFALALAALAVMGLALTAVPGSLPASGAQTFSLDDLMARLAKIPARESRFTETKHLAALDRPLTSTGRLIFRRPDHLEQITEAPRPETLVVDGDTLTLSEPGQPAETVALDQHPEIQALVDAVRGPLSGDLAELQRHYLVRAEGSLDDWRLVLLPRNVVTRLVDRVEIDGAGTEIRRIGIEEANGDRLTLRVTDAP